MAVQRGIFCLEGDWWNDFNRKSTVKPVLKLLSQGTDGPVDFVHRDVATREELAHYLSRWAQRGMKRYPILYLAFHGEPNTLFVGDQRRKGHAVTLDELADLLGNKLAGRIVHFGSCSTLGLDKRHVTRFLKKTNALAATGFRTDVPWLKSSAFEVLMFEALLRHKLTPAGARKMDRELAREVGYLRREFKFRMVINGR